MSPTSAPVNARGEIPLFIVGAPRSGTTMLAAMLGAHPRIAAGPETQFFNKISAEELEQAVRDPHWPTRACALVNRLELVKQPVVGLFGLDEADIAAFLTQRPPSVAAMLEALCLQFAERSGKPRWAEKTPNHLQFVEQIRASFPLSPIIRIVRDPRDSAVSTCKLPSFSTSAIANAYLWREWYDTSREFFATDANVLTLRYEDLVCRPEAELTRICTFIGEGFAPAMLEFGKTAKNVSSQAETWKKPVSGELRQDRLYAWKNVLSEDEQRVCEMVCAEYLDEFGYEINFRPARTARAYRLSRGYVERFERLLVREARQGRRWLPAQDIQRADKLVNPPRAGARSLRSGLRFVLGLGTDALRWGTLKAGF